MKKFNVTVNGVSYEVAVEEISAAAPAAPVKPITSTAQPAPAPVVSSPTAAVSAPVQVGQAETPINSPMPGKIIKIMVEVGQEVKKGEIILILEAMKMQNEIPAPVAGAIKSIHVNTAQNVKPGEVLAVIG
ncbi:MAG: gcdC [Firmicutes bacterium]|nr:gcdC [Bacillota bacterium]